MIHSTQVLFVDWNWGFNILGTLEKRRLVLENVLQTGRPSAPNKPTTYIYWWIQYTSTAGPQNLRSTVATQVLPTVTDSNWGKQINTCVTTKKTGKNTGHPSNQNSPNWTSLGWNYINWWNSFNKKNQLLGAYSPQHPPTTQWVRGVSW